ncbi:MAG: hypothetical protein V1754_12390, partial [Pseudomonadota bacterium]
MAAKGAREQKKYRLLLVNPRCEYKHYAAQDEVSHLAGKKKMTVPLSLLIVAAVTPQNHEIKIIDEESDIIPEDFHPDIVGITTLTTTSARAHKIAA